MHAGESVNLGILVEIMKELKADIGGLKSDISHLNESVNSLRETVSSLEECRNHTASGMNTSIASHAQQLSHVMDMMDSLDSKLVSVNATMREDMSSLKSTLIEAVKSQQASVNRLSQFVSNMSEDLVQHENNTISEIGDLHTSLNYTHTELNTNMEILDSKVVSVNDTVASTMEMVSNLSESVSTYTEQLKGLVSINHEIKSDIRVMELQLKK